MSLELIRFRPEFRQDAARLLTAFWPDPAESAALFTWLMEENPYTETPLAYLALLDGKVAAMRGFYGARWEVPGSGETVDMPCGTMFATDPAVRGQGLGKFVVEGALADLARQGYPYVLSFSAEAVTYRIQERQGWQTVQSYRPVTRDTGRLRLRRSLGRSFPFLRQVAQFVRRHSAPRAVPVSAPAVATFATLDGGTPDTVAGGTLRVTQSPDGAYMAEVAEAAAEPGLIRHVRTAEHFRWRYRAPDMEYRFLHWSQGTDRGFLVLEARRRVAGPVRIVDWDVTDDSVLKHLIGAAADFGGFSGLSVWRAGFPAGLAGFLAERGFAELVRTTDMPGYRPGMMVKSLTGVPAEAPWEVLRRSITDPGNWSLRQSYSL